MGPFIGKEGGRDGRKEKSVDLGLGFGLVVEHLPFVYQTSNFVFIIAPTHNKILTHTPKEEILTECLILLDEEHCQCFLTGQYFVYLISDSWIW